MSARDLERASFLRSRRQRLTPQEVGLPHTSRRRTPTLRREDVAWLAGVGITWYTWLEQGRPIKIATGTLDRVASALRLDPSESEYLRKLVSANGKERPRWKPVVSDRVRMLVEQFSTGCAFAVSPRWDILASNHWFSTLFPIDGHGRNYSPTLDRNALWNMFTRWRETGVFADWEAVARRMVATFRLASAEYPGDAEFAELFDALSVASRDFVEMWENVDVLLPMLWSVGEIREPGTGATLEVETINLSSSDSPGQMVVFYLPVGEAVAFRASFKRRSTDFLPP